MTLRRCDYLRVDVFTDRPLGGNPVTVFPTADGLTSEQMQAVAREMNLSETVFCLPPELPAAAGRRGADVRLRIFTVDREVPLAGHPTVGTVHALLETGLLAPPADAAGRVTVYCELGVGVLPVTALRRADGGIEQVTMTQRTPRFGSPLHAPELAARALGLDAAAVDDTVVPIRVVDTGIPWLLIPLVDRDAVRAIRPRFEVCRELAERAGTDLLHAFATFRDAADAWCVHTRHVFFGAVTPGEDPATGSAAGCLGAHLVEQGLVPVGDGVTLTVLQGAEVGRPARIRVEIGGDEDAWEVRVGGDAVLVGRGELDVPPSLPQ